MKITSGTDILLALLYARGSTGKCNEAIAGTTKLEKFMFLLSRDANLEEPIKKDYDFVPDNYGPCSHELFDDLEMLKDAEFVKEEERSIFSPLDEGDSEACLYASQDSEVYPQTRLKIFSLTQKGERLGKILFESLSQEEQKKIVLLKQLYNKRPVSKIIRDVYNKYPEMIGESKIKGKVLAQ